MSDANAGRNWEGWAELEAHQRPAAGIIADGQNGNEVAGAILRSLNAGYDPFIAAMSAGAEGAEFARLLGLEVVTSEERFGTRDEAWDSLAQAARKNGYPGLFRYDDLSLAIDFMSSEAAVSETERYVIEPVFEPRVQADLKVLVAIPAYNEGPTIADVIDGATPHADEVLVIDDGSTDSTAEEAHAAGATVIEHETNKGYGGALKTAFVEAERSGAEYLVILDGDGQHDPSDIPSLIEQEEDGAADIVIGSRFEEGSETDLPLYRRFGLRIVNTLTNLSLGVVRKQSRIADTQSGFRAYNKRAIESLAAEDGIGDHMGASTDILYHAHRHGYCIDEVGTTIDYNVESASSQNPVSHGLQLVQNILRTVERERPITVLGVPGFVSSVLGVGFGYLTFANYLNTGTFPLGLALLSVFFTLAGIFAAFTAIILHSLETHLK